jgi:MOSC domain-containing protein
MATTVGSVEQLWRFPVKSMGGSQLDEATITERGVLGDRAYALIDLETGKVASAKSVKSFPDLLRCRAAFVEPPSVDGELPPVRIGLPNGTSVISDSRDADRTLSAFWHREVRLAKMAPDDFTIDQYHPDVEGADPGGHRSPCRQGPTCGTRECEGPSSISLR